jgi:beta-glucuronidase
MTASSIRPQRNAYRDMIDMSGLWRALPDPQGLGEAQGWARGLVGPTLSVAVPGSWNEQLAEAGLMNYVGDMWFETDVFVPATFSGRDIALRFGSADYSASVWVNGHPVGTSAAEHLPFELDVTAAVTPGSRALVVVLVSNLLPEQGPTQRVSLSDYAAEGRPRDEYLPTVRFDFFPYGGLNRPVYLIALPKSRVSNVRLTPRLDGEAGVISVQIKHVGVAQRAKVTVSDSTRLESLIVPLSNGAGAGELRLLACPLWSPDNPHLLDVCIELQATDGAVADQINLRTGVREIKTEGNQLLLNGLPLLLKGFGKHEDSPVRGRGLDLPQMVKDFQLLEWCGANSVRTSHYPYAEEFYDLCDEQGILVIDEVFSINLDFRRVQAEGLAAHKAAITQLIERDYNHPCVIAWSLANEPGYLGEKNYSQASAPYWKALFAHARSLDASRPMTHANVGYAGLDDPAFDEADLIMINRYYGWYQEPAQLDRATVRLRLDFDALAATHGKPIFVSEFGADALAGQHATYPQLFTEDYQSDLIAAYWQAILSHPDVIGGHVWNFADFRTAQHGRRVVFNLKGVFTRDRTPKKAAFTVRRLWSDPAKTGLN